MHPKTIPLLITFRPGVPEYQLDICRQTRWDPSPSGMRSAYSDSRCDWWTCDTVGLIVGKTISTLAQYNCIYCGMSRIFILPRLESGLCRGTISFETWVLLMIRCLDASPFRDFDDRIESKVRDGLESNRHTKLVSRQAFRKEMCVLSTL